ncbi:MAG: PrsW family glutamic-type intramembrane protease, partial [Candidatus Taylorbacteria bacterium]
GSFFYAIIAGLLPSLIWLFFWLREDTHSQPRSLITSLFFGGMIAVIIAIFCEKFISLMVANDQIQYTLWAAVEEIGKFIVVGAIAMNSINNKEPVDAMIYCVAAALGFAALENTLFIMDPFSHGDVARGIVTGNMRFIGATLVHIVSSACVGFTYGYVFYSGKFLKTIAILIGLAGAIAIHASFNLSILHANPTDTLKTFAWIWGAVVFLIILFEEVKAVHMRKLQKA